MKTILLSLILCGGLTLSAPAWAEWCHDRGQAEFSMDFRYLLTKKILWLQQKNNQAVQAQHKDVLFALRHFSQRWQALLLTRYQTCQAWQRCQSQQAYCAAPQMEYQIARVKLIQFFNYVEQVSINHKEFQLPVKP